MAEWLPAEPPRKRRFKPPTPEIGWRVFATQQMAFTHVDEVSSGSGDHAMDNSIWSLELDSSGRRSYMVASKSDFWRRYKQLPPTHRHYYELIREGRPCHLYFDLEFHRQANPDNDGERMVATLRTEVELALKAQFFPDVQGPLQWRVVDLDSSTPKKFSRHLIIRLADGSAFADNAHCGHFVHALVSSLVARRRSEPLIQELFVLPAPPPEPSQHPAPAVGQTGAAAADAGESCAVPSVGANSTSGAAQAGAAADAAAAAIRPTETHAAAPVAVTSASAPATRPSRVCFVDLSVYTRNRCFRLYKSSKAGKAAELQPAATRRKGSTSCRTVKSATSSWRLSSLTCRRARRCSAWTALQDTRPRWRRWHSRKRGGDRT